MPSWLPTLIFVPIVGFVLYRRYKRTFGRQPIVPSRIWMRIAVLAAFSGLSVVTARSAMGYAAAGVGAVIGVALAFVGLAHTTFETTPQGRFYTTKPWVGLAVTALFLGRLGARVFALYTAPPAAGAGADPFAGAQRSPFTVGIFLVLAAYYVAFYVGVLRKSKA